MNTMAQPGYLEPAAMADMAMPLGPAVSDQNHLLPVSDHHLCREWPAWDGQMATPPNAQQNGWDTLVSLQQGEREGHPLFGTPEPVANGAIATWPSQITDWPIYHQQDTQSVPSTGFSQQVQWLAPTSPPSAAASSAWPPRPEMQSQNRASTGASSRSTRIKTRPGSSSSTIRKAPNKQRIGSYGQSSPATSTDDSVHLIEDSDGDGVKREQPPARPRVEKGKTTYRAKNRVAAKRCREKTKQHEIDLANKEKEVTQQRMYLDACVTALKNEVLTLKNQILQHSDCDCDMVQGYIARAASGIGMSGARMPSHAP